MAPIFFELNNTKYPITLNYLQCLRVLPERFGISLTKIFTDNDAAVKTMEALVLDDERTLQLAWFYIEPTASIDEEAFLELVDGRDLERFREAFWQAVVNFFGPLKRNVLTDLWNQFKRDLKKAELQSGTSDSSLSDSNPEG